MVSVVQRGNKLSLRGTIDKKQYTYATGKEANAVNRRWLEKNKEREFIKLHEKKHRERSGATFKDYGRMVIENTSSRRNGFSQDESMKKLERLNEVFGDMLVEHIKASDILRWQNRMLQRVTPKTVKNYRSVLASIFKMAYADGIIDRNPLDFVEVPRQPKREIETYTIEEVRKIIRACEEPFRNFVQLMFFTGMRPGEMIALRWSDISFETETIIVQRRRREGVVDVTKSKKKRVIDMLPQAKEALMRQRRHTGLAKDVFLTQHGVPYQESETLRRQFKTAVKRAGVKELRMYDMRHTFITIMAQSGMPESWIIQQVGHSKIDITYEHYMGRVKVDTSRVKNIAI
ncbi:tyrosine-type recombinase/integrase [Hydrogenimonas urashimensis]|uniref:tyrosine-type recombinase/integrase n=1 Tax=Hydrogenimonas urashimensis TaxID=2740515 RepID=UPI001915760A|nr:site-specific integrase [Hydrogenimonas urashimensis]